jgi:hypothetical protein
MDLWDNPAAKSSIFKASGWPATTGLINTLADDGKTIAKGNTRDFCSILERFMSGGQVGSRHKEGRGFLPATLKVL